MIYESSLKHMKTKRAARKQGSKNITALEVYDLLEMMVLKSFVGFTFCPKVLITW